MSNIKGTVLDTFTCYNGFVISLYVPAELLDDIDSITQEWKTDITFNDTRYHYAKMAILKRANETANGEIEWENTGVVSVAYLKDGIEPTDDVIDGLFRCMNQLRSIVVTTDTHATPETKESFHDRYVKFRNRYIAWVRELMKL